MSVQYDKTNWVAEVTPTSPANMNHIEGGIQGNSAPVVTQLPSAANAWAPFGAEPATGQEIIYRVNDGGGTIVALWRLMYVQGATYPWYAVGTPTPMHAQTVDTVTFAPNFAGNGAYQDSPSTAAPSLVLPLAGDYFIEHGHASYNDANAGFVAQSFAIGATAALDGDWAVVQSPTPSVSQAQSSASVRRKKTALAAAATVKLQVKGTNAATLHWRNPWLSIFPFRVI